MLLCYVPTGFADDALTKEKMVAIFVDGNNSRLPGNRTELRIDRQHILK